MNPLKTLEQYGQSVWLDDLSRTMVESGKLRELIDRDGLRGITSNPSIFEKAIAQTNDYDDIIAAMVKNGKGVDDIYETIATQDVRMAADELRRLYDQNPENGMVSLEVSPHMAYDAQGTIEEGRRLWQELDKPNVFIKVPATQEGLVAIRTLISEGVNVNVTLLFGLGRYREVTEAYIAGLEARLEAGNSVEGVASVASFFLSRIDVLLDPQLEKRIEQGGAKGELAATLHGQVAIASAKVAYTIYQEVFATARFKRLAEAGAKPQRLLWASTGAKNPAFSDTKYVEPLIGPDTVNTMPQDTLDAYRDHGEPAARLEHDVSQAKDVLTCLDEVGIDLDAATAQLEREGVDKFIKPFDSLMATLKEATEQAPA